MPKRREAKSSWLREVEAGVAAEPLGKEEGSLAFEDSGGAERARPGRGVSLLLKSPPLALVNTTRLQASLQHGLGARAGHPIIVLHMIPWKKSDNNRVAAFGLATEEVQQSQPNRPKAKARLL